MLPSRSMQIYVRAPACRTTSTIKKCQRHSDPPMSANFSIAIPRGSAHKRIHIQRQTILQIKFGALTSRRSRHQHRVSDSQILAVVLMIHRVTVRVYTHGAHDYVTRTSCHVGRGVWRMASRFRHSSGCVSDGRSTVLCRKTVSMRSARLT